MLKGATNTALPRKSGRFDFLAFQGTLEYFNARQLFFYEILLKKPWK